MERAFGTVDSCPQRLLARHSASGLELWRLVSHGIRDTLVMRRRAGLGEGVDRLQQDKGVEQHTLETGKRPVDAGEKSSEN